MKSVFPKDWPKDQGIFVVYDKTTGDWREFARSERSAKIFKTRLNKDFIYWEHEVRGNTSAVAPYDYVTDTEYFTMYPETT